MTPTYYDLLYHGILVMPAFMCLSGLMIMALSGRFASFKRSNLLLGLLCFSGFVSQLMLAIYTSGIGNFEYFFIVDIVGTFFTLLFPVLMILYFRSILASTKESRWVFLMLLPPVIMAGMLAVLYTRIGYANSGEYLRQYFDLSEYFGTYKGFFGKLWGSTIKDSIEAVKVHLPQGTRLVSFVTIRRLIIHLYNWLMVAEALLMVGYVLYRRGIYRSHMENIMSQVDVEERKLKSATHWIMVNFILLMTLMLLGISTLQDHKFFCILFELLWTVVMAITFYKFNNNIMTFADMERFWKENGDGDSFVLPYVPDATQSESEKEPQAEEDATTIKPAVTQAAPISSSDVQSVITTQMLPASLDPSGACAPNPALVEEETTIQDDKLSKVIRDWEQSEEKPFLKESITISEVSQQMRINPRLLSNYLNSIYRLNFNTWINNLRVQEAVNMMRSSDKLSVADIATATGFADTTAMGRAFKRLYNMSPSEFKKKRAS
ncbi:MAG: helix-turn-helix transcriptional regulator [Bacteroidales bacterium]|nr:helix-turn-helix transcriptional regulator [Bacteroidales bacterium]